MSTKCADFHELLSALADGELAEADRASVGAHLDLCPECRALAERFRRLDAAVARGLTPPAVPAERWDRMFAEIKRAGRVRQAAVLRPAPARPFRAVAWAAAAAAGLAMVASLLLAGGHKSQEYSSAEIMAVEPSDGEGQTLVMSAPEGGLSLVIVSSAVGPFAPDAAAGG